MQHLLLPLVLGTTVLLVGWLRAPSWRWQGLAIVAGGVGAGDPGGVQQPRDADHREHEDQCADVADGAAPASSDPAQTAAKLGLDRSVSPGSAATRGNCRTTTQKRHVRCPHFTRTRELALLVAEPMTAVRLGLNGIGEVDSWLAKNLGTVEGGATDPLPEEIPSLGRVLSAYPAIRLTLIFLPLIAFATLLFRRQTRLAPADLLFAALAAATIVATYAVTILGDGLADVYAKQCHLVFGTALAGALSVSSCLLARVLGGRGACFARPTRTLITNHDRTAS